VGLSVVPVVVVVAAAAGDETVVVLEVVDVLMDVVAVDD
jgi:hypothetical protein